MENRTKIDEVFDNYKENFKKMHKRVSEATDSYSFEANFHATVHEFVRHLYEAVVGGEERDKNKRKQLHTSLGVISINKEHPLARTPGGFKMSPYLQAQVVRIGTKMVYEEASEELDRLTGLKITAKQVERVCHHYGELLETEPPPQIEPPQSSQDKLYVMVDGSMLQTREKEHKWKEVKLCRIFTDSSRVEGISKNRNQLLESHYVAHLGEHREFYQKVNSALPIDSSPVFIADGAKWIWNWIDHHYPESVQILDYYHCKEHLYQFAKKYYEEEEEKAGKTTRWVEARMESLMSDQVSDCLEAIKTMVIADREKSEERDKLYHYLSNHEKRISYGSYKKQGLFIGSGSIESAHRNVIQKRMKLSGQRWSLSGAQQMLNLRTCYKSGLEDKIISMIVKGKYAA